MDLSFTVKRGTKDRKRVIRFYDPDFIGQDFGPQGQFTGAAYYVETLTESREALELHGLTLDGGIEKWRLTAEQVKETFCALDEYNLTY